MAARFGSTDADEFTLQQQNVKTKAANKYAVKVLSDFMSGEIGTMDIVVLNDILQDFYANVRTRRYQHDMDPYACCYCGVTKQTQKQIVEHTIQEHPTNEVLGFDVSTINSVQFSNHTGYGKFKGQVLNASDVECLYEGLKENNIHNFSHLLTGYIGSKSFLEKVGDIIKDMKKTNPDLTYVCDPVMGDNGNMYVPPELLPVYKDTIVPLADIITPNQYEAELLTGRTINNEEDAMQAMEDLHKMGPKTIVISSSTLGSNGSIMSLASSVKNGSKEKFKIEFRYIPAIFVGTGDLFAACLMAWMQTDKNLQVALEKTTSTLQAVIKRTLQFAQEKAGPGNKPNSAQMELRLVQSKADIENPEILYKAVPL